MNKKFLIITGASGGIGNAITKTYLNDGYTVIGIDKKNALEKLPDYHHIKIDLARFTIDCSYRNKKLKKIITLIPTSIDEFVLINNAAEQVIKPIPEIKFEDLEKSFLVNTFAPFFLTQCFKKELALHKGRVINISSIHAKLTKRDFACYAASKAALESLTRSLALELSPIGISINSIAPAAIMTPMLASGFKKNPEMLNKLQDYHPSKSIGNTEDFALFVKSISDHKSGFLTGSVLDFDGGIGVKLNDPKN